MAYGPKATSCDPLNTLTIHDIHKLIKSIFMYKFTTDNLSSNFANYFVKNASGHDHATPSSHLFRPPIFKYDLARNTLRTQGPLLWNSISVNYRNALSCNVFKKNYKNYIISLYH